ncbi:hypothetical protein V8E55_012125 [Tylopilus felleus]
MNSVVHGWILSTTTTATRHSGTTPHTTMTQHHAPTCCHHHNDDNTTAHALSLSITMQREDKDKGAPFNIAPLTTGRSLPLRAYPRVPRG